MNAVHLPFTFPCPQFNPGFFLYIYSLKAKAEITLKTVSKLFKSDIYLIQMCHLRCLSSVYSHYQKISCTDSFHYVCQYAVKHCLLLKSPALLKTSNEIMYCSAGNVRNWNENYWNANANVQRSISREGKWHILSANAVNKHDWWKHMTYPSTKKTKPHKSPPWGLKYIFIY